MNIKEIIMALIWLALVGLLYVLKTGPNYFQTIDNQEMVLDQSVEHASDDQPLVQKQDSDLPETIRTQVEIPNWLPDDLRFNEDNLTTDDLVTLAQLAIDKGHIFFPESQNALYYMMAVKSSDRNTSQVSQILTDYLNLTPQGINPKRDYRICNTARDNCLNEH